MLLKRFLLLVVFYYGITFAYGQDAKYTILDKVLNNYIDDLSTNGKIESQDTLLVEYKLKIDSTIELNSNIKLVSNVCTYLSDKNKEYYILHYTLNNLNKNFLEVQIRIEQIKRAGSKPNKNGACSTTEESLTKYNKLRRNYLISYNCDKNDWEILNK
jgi:hypothetical protein